MKTVKINNFFEIRYLLGSFFVGYFIMPEEFENFNEPKFVYSIRNVSGTTLILSDLGQKGFYIKQNQSVALHELFPYHKLMESKGLRDAIQHGLVEVVQKKLLSPVSVGTPTEKENKELENLKAQIADLKSFMESKPDQPTITHQTVDVESIKNGLTKEIEDLKNLLKTSQENQPQIQSQSFDSEALSKQIADTINAQVSQLIKSQSTNGEFKLEGYEETKPEDIATSNLVNTYDKMSQSVKLDSKKTVQEDISDSNIDDNADLLSMLP